VYYSFIYILVCKVFGNYWQLISVCLGSDEHTCRNVLIVRNGDDVNLTNCRIVGELNLSKIQLKTVTITDLRIIMNNIAIEDSKFENKIDFSNVQFNNTVSFKKPFFKNSADFQEADFFNSANFHDTNFNKDANFSGAIINDTSNFIGLGNPDKIKLTTNIPPLLNTK